MRKTSCLWLLLCLFAISMQAASYGILINGNRYYAGAKNNNPQDPSFEEYAVLGVPVEAGDQLQLCDKENAATWAVVLDSWSVAGFSLSGDHYVSSVSGCYDFYIKLKWEADQLYIGPSTGDCSSNTGEPYEGGSTGGGGGDNPGGGNSGSTNAVPDRCGDVMLQAFYWDSYTNKEHGDTKWKTLQAQADEIAVYFDLVWLPPSAKSSGGVGYIPMQYCNQNSAWGSAAELKTLIETLHNGGARVVADMVVNHGGNKSSWCDFYEEDFGTYGSFSPDASWICRNDEVNSDPSAGDCNGKATGKYDDGYGSEANYGAARDWDHDSEKVREMFRAYAKWLVNEVGYDGFRYDYCKGFHNSHINDYNTNANAYFSVMEYWDGDAGVLWQRINDAGKNTLTFDFATKYQAFNSGIAGGNYSGCRMSGLLGGGHSKYAVTFIDNHDTYARDNNEFGGSGNSMKAYMKDKLLQSNAFLLSMPGVPCVFYPHWKEYKAEIAPMVLARKAVGVHSESSVSDEASNGGYRATVTGTNGSLILELGDKVSANHAGYTKMASGNGYAIWVKTTQAVAPELLISPASCTYKTPTLEVSMQTVGGTSTSTIYYTLDGSDPTTSSTCTTYAAPFYISGSVTLKAYAVSGDPDKSGQVAQTAVKTCVYTYEAPQETPITVAFLKPDDWATVNLYAWLTGGGAVTELRGNWPGTPMTDISEDGLYYYTFEKEVKEVNFIFNNGTDQTADLWTDCNVCYTWEAGAEKVLEDCSLAGNTAIENVENEVPAINLSAPMYNVLGQRVSEDYIGVVIQDGHKYLLFPTSSR